MGLLVFITVFSPFLGALFVGILGGISSFSYRDRLCQVITTILLFISCFAAMFLFYEIGWEKKLLYLPLFTWINVGSIQASWGLYVDTLTAVMFFIVTLISALVHLYSIAYMSHDSSIPRFMSYLSLFTFFMLVLVSSSNFAQLFFGWEGVGLTSYLLIGFWYTKPAANNAAIKAFLMNRIADIGLILGIGGILYLFHTLNFQAIFQMSPFLRDVSFSFFGIKLPALGATCLFLFIGAMGKSAQIGFHPWLADAMEGPTPVSALIHSATMVTAGVFLIVRLSPLFELCPSVLNFIAIVGGITAFFAGTIALTQYDIKRVIAYSTCSQLGYMFMAIGLSAYGAAIFHLFTHAFFKALLFLGAGSVIHALSNEQDMRQMGGISQFIPLTCALMWIGSLALVGLPFFSGFYSKETILEIAWGRYGFTGQFCFWVGVATTFLTALYSWRLLLLTFSGEPRADDHIMAHIHESPVIMLLPLGILALGSIFGGYLGYGIFILNEGDFWGNSISFNFQRLILQSTHYLHRVESFFVEIFPIIILLIGISIAFLFYVFKPRWPKRISLHLKEIYLFCYNDGYFDVAYDLLFIKPIQKLAYILWTWGDIKIIDGWGPRGISIVTEKGYHRLSAIQTGSLSFYIFFIVLGTSLLITFGLCKFTWESIFYLISPLCPSLNGRLF